MRLHLHEETPTLIRFRVTAAALFGLILGCGDHQTVSGPPAIARVTVSPDSADVYLGKTRDYAAFAWDATGKKILGVHFTWTSSAQAVATVDTGGVVSGVAFGTARVTASASGDSASAVARVTYAPVGHIEVAYQESVPVLDTMQITVTIYSVYNEVITGPRVVFYPDTAVFTVDSTGLAVARGVGPMGLAISVDYAYAQPTLVGVADYQSISGGRNHTCGITQHGWTLCWGGIPTGADPSRVRSIPFLASDRVKLTAVASGSGFSCGIAVDGHGYCWGANEGGQLGNGMNTTTEQFVEVQGAAPLVSITAGEYHACGLRADSTAWCWGSNGGSSIGVGPPSSGIYLPTPVAGAHRFTTIDARGQLTCGVTQGGTIYCWGIGAVGADSATAIGLDTVPTPVLANTPFRTVTVGPEHACALTETDDAYCWGTGAYGRLGTGTQDDQPVPVQVATNLKFVSIAAGWRHTCALTAGGAAYCWGSNQGCQLGNGACNPDSLADMALTPQPVTGSIAFRTLTAGYIHTCGLSVDGRVYCWGGGDAGELGAGDEFRSHPVPTVVYGQR